MLRTEASERPTRRKRSLPLPYRITFQWHDRRAFGQNHGMSLLEKVVAIAVEAHRGKKDQAGQPFILHPSRMMFSVETEDEQIVAVLHDVIEDHGDVWPV
jgi:(p)ppGpp synthase/HD superfamily hydrolase